jgi:hypothetical protein
MSPRSEANLRRPGALLVIAGVAAAAVGLFGVPLGTVLLVGLFLLCPLMMLGMHGGGPAGGLHEDTTQVAPRPDGSDAPRSHGH